MEEFSKKLFNYYKNNVKDNEYEKISLDEKKKRFIIIMLISSYYSSYIINNKLVFNDIVNKIKINVESQVGRLQNIKLLDFKCLLKSIKYLLIVSKKYSTKEATFTNLNDDNSTTLSNYQTSILEIIRYKIDPSKKSVMNQFNFFSKLLNVGKVIGYDCGGQYGLRSAIKIVEKVEYIFFDVITKFKTVGNKLNEKISNLKNEINVITAALSTITARGGNNDKFKHNKTFKKKKRILHGSRKIRR
jgi:hypothetical protein